MLYDPGNESGIRRVCPMTLDVGTIMPTRAVTLYWPKSFPDIHSLVLGSSTTIFALVQR